MNLLLPDSWHNVLKHELNKSYFLELQQFLEQERSMNTVYPAEQEIFSALEVTPYHEVKVLILGQDPYINENQAHGLCFSVRPGVKPPPSLANIYKELRTDLGCETPPHGFLQHWASQGVLMLNAVLSVRANSANSHKNRGWEMFTDEIIRQLNAKTQRVVFILWGAYAQKKVALIKGDHHVIIQSAHPSPLSARNGFFGSKPFSRANQALLSAGHLPIDWQLPRNLPGLA